MNNPEYQRSVLEAVVETVPDGILVVDENREFFTYNEQFVDMWGIPDEVVDSGDDQRALESVLDELEHPEEFLETVEYFYDHPSETGQELIHLRDGRVFERYTAPATDDGSYYGRIWVFEDITERRQQKQQLQRQNDRLEEFVSVISHDLRNPLNVVLARVEIVRNEYDSEHLDTIRQAAERMEALIDDLLTLARDGQTRADVAPVGLPALIEDCWQNVPTVDATLVTETDQTIRADEKRARQLFENLIRNAVEHGGDDVTVTVGDLDEGFYIEDDGSGLAVEDREKVFEVGYSTSQQGTGLGLSIVDQVVEAHDWSITISESSEGGTRFEITGVETQS